jgi:hypothetical protein
VAGKTPYGRGNKRCKNYNTCLGDGVTAKTNMHILDGLKEGREATLLGNTTLKAAGVGAAFAKVESQLLIIYYQAALRYAYLLDDDVIQGSAVQGGDHQGEGWAFWRVIEPIVGGMSALHKQEADKITAYYTTSNPVRSTPSSYTRYCTLKWLLENSLPSGTTAADMGTLTAAASVTCPTESPTLNQSTDDDGISAGTIVAIVVGIVVSINLIVLIMYLTKNSRPTTKNVNVQEPGPQI